MVVICSITSKTRRRGMTSGRCRSRGSGSRSRCCKHRLMSGSAQFSPDGKWIAYESNASGRTEVYVRAFPVSSGQWQVSNQGGTRPKWRADGKELFYLGA